MVVMLNVTMTIMVMREMATPILVWRSDDVHIGVGKMWLVHMEKFPFLIDNGWGTMLCLALRRMVRLGLFLIDNGWGTMLCLALR
jgi:hypothetical protein